MFGQDLYLYIMCRISNHVRMESCRANKKTQRFLEETAKKTEIATLLNTFERKMKSIGEKQADDVLFS